jgi:hypothetical protein
MDSDGNLLNRFRFAFVMGAGVISFDAPAAYWRYSQKTRCQSEDFGGRQGNVPAFVFKHGTGQFPARNILLNHATLLTSKTLQRASCIPNSLRTMLTPTEEPCPRLYTTG